MTEKIKIVHLITLLELGGAQGNTLYTTTHLDSSRYDVHLWTGQGGFWDKEVERTWSGTGRFKFFSTLKRPLHPFYDLLAAFDLFRSLRKLRPDILHTHSSKAGILGRMAGTLARVPHIIHTYHGFGFNNHQKPWTKLLFVWLEKFSAFYSEKLIFVSEANQKEARQLKIGQPNQYVLIRSGISLNQLINKASLSDRVGNKRSLGLKAGPVITTIGAFKPQKNLLEFIAMAKEVSLQIPNAQFLIVGDGDQRTYIENKVFELNLQDKVNLLGWRQDIPSILALTDVFVLTSLWEGLPRALVEAMAIGIPSVCYETDGVRDLLQKGGGIIVPQRDWKKLSLHVIEFLENKEKYFLASSEAKNLIGQEFDIDHMVNQLDKLYLSLV